VNRDLYLLRFCRRHWFDDNGDNNLTDERPAKKLPAVVERYYGKPALQRAKVTKQVSYHTFRHTFGTLLNANGENPKVVQELLRHASLKVTTDVYMQAVGPQEREAQSNLVKLVRKGADLEIKPAQVDQIGSCRKTAGLWKSIVLLASPTGFEPVLPP
jgi:integrase